MSTTTLTGNSKAATVTRKQYKLWMMYTVKCFKDGKPVRGMAYKTHNRADAYDYANWWIK